MTQNLDRVRARSLGRLAARFAEAAGADPNPRNTVGLGIVALIGFLVDLGAFHLILTNGGELSTAHVAAFLVASVLSFTLNSIYVFPSRQDQRSIGILGRFLGMGVLTLALRGGVIVGTIDLIGLPTQIGIGAGVATTAIVQFLGSMCFVFSTGRARAPELRWRVWAIAAIAYALALKLTFIGLFELLPEEAYYWDYAQHPDWSYLDHPPMIAWLIGIGTTLFGDTEFGVRIGTFLLGTVTLRWLVLLTRNLYGRHAALGAAMLVAGLPFLFVTGFFAMPDSPLIAFWTGALYYFERALFGERQRAWLGVGVCFGLGLLSKYTMALLGPAVLLFMLIDRDARAHFKRPGPYLALLVAAAVFSPVIYWNATHEWASFAFQGSRRMDAPTGFSLHILLLFIVALLTPIGVLTAVRSLIGRGDRRRFFLAICTALPLSVFVAYSITHRTMRLTWTEPIWLAAVPAMAYRLWPLWREQQFASKVWRITIVLVLIFFGGTLHYVTLGFPGTPPPKLHALSVGWRDAAGHVDRIVAEVLEETGERPIVVGVRGYYFGSELNFYGARNTTVRTAPHLIGGTGVMYSLWDDPKQFAGKPVLLVALKRNKLERPSIPKYFERLGPIREQAIEFLGKTSSRFLYRVGYGYRPRPRRATADDHTKPSDR